MSIGVGGVEALDENLEELWSDLGSHAVVEVVGEPLMAQINDLRGLSWKGSSTEHNLKLPPSGLPLLVDVRSLSPGEGVGGDLLLMSVDLRSDEVVYETHARELVRFATGIVGHDDAPDVVADAFLRLVTSPAWAEARDRRALWFRAVTFEAGSSHRSAIRRRTRERTAAANTNLVSPAPELADERLRDALDQLSVQQRAVVVLTYWQDLRPADVAKLLGITEGSVRKQLARARKRLRGALK